jgi:phosphonoacetaldehyde hydrolase
MTSQLKAVVFDWAGTMIDFGCRAPVIALQRVFEGAGVPISEAEARADMGMAKRDHIRALLQQPRVASAWADAKGQAAAEPDVSALHDAVEPLMVDAARDCAVMIPGAVDTVRWLRARNVKIGSSTGYTRPMMADILPLAAAAGYSPDVVVCSGETHAGRPSPLMMWKNLLELGVWPLSSCVKVDDAPVGIEEGRAAGVWTIGVAASGNGVGLSLDDLAALSDDDRAARIAASRDVLLKAGAHVVIDTVADLPQALERIAFGGAVRT